MSVYNYEINDHFSCKRIIFSTLSQNMTETCNDFRIYRLLRSHFLKKKTWKTPIFHIYRPLPYSSRDGENMLSSCPPSVEITPKIPAKFASLNSSIAFGDLRLGGCLRGRRNFRGDFWFGEHEEGMFAPRKGRVVLVFRARNAFFSSSTVVLLYEYCMIDEK